MATRRIVPTTAEYLLAFAKELTDGGMEPSLRYELLLIAAKTLLSEDGLTVRRNGDG